MILLDTNAIIWIVTNHARTRALADGSRRLFVSPVSLLELQILEEGGRVRVAGGTGSVVADDRWRVDDPASAALFTAALELTWTREPYDRLLAAHARLRGWRLATADAALLAGLGPRFSFEL